MSIRPELFEYLDHLGRTVPVRELASNADRRDVVALRHDIDHSLDLALELAHYEHARGIRATYYLLHTHRYWDDPDLVLKCQQLQAYGHEVGVHVNALTEWFAGRCDDPAASIRRALEPLRAGGVEVTGVSAHGDRACYERGFINYWMWRELRGDDPKGSQHGRSAEGVPVDDPKWQVPYPDDDVLRRDDGGVLPLWSSSLEALGLRYDATHTVFDHYWTDTGGGWSRSGDPLKHDLSRGRHQVLIHPWWWRGPQKLVFIVSTARSGTVWLSRFIDRATSSRGLHEFTFNHRLDDDTLVQDKRTTNDLDTLCDNRPLAIDLMRQSLRWMRRQPGDVCEANVYLEPFVTELRELAPEATLVHLHRDGRDVVRSILNRGWYASPQDHKHRAMPVNGWSRMNQFERACWYWRCTNESIMPHTSARIRFERMVDDQAYLTRRLEGVGIVVHPLLAEQVFDTPMNQSRETAFGRFSTWPSEYQRAFQSICGELEQALGYGMVDPEVVPGGSFSGQQIDVMPMPAARVLLDIDFSVATRPNVVATNVVVKTGPTGLAVTADARAREVTNRVLLLTRGAWGRVKSADGLPCRAGEYYTCEVSAQVPDGLAVRLFALFYDGRGNQMRKLQVGTLRSDATERVFSFSPAHGASHMSLALHLGGARPGLSMTLERVRLAALSMDERYAARVSVGQPAGH